MIAASLAGLSSHRGVSRLALPLLLLFAAACGGDDPPAPAAPSPPSILSFGADPEQLPGPGTTTLSWSIADARSWTLTQDQTQIASSSDSDPEGIQLQGSLEVRIEETTVFELIAVGAGVEPISAEATVVVEAPREPPSIASFGGEDAVTAEDEGPSRVTLSWRGVEGADELLLQAGDWELSLDPTQTPEGSVEVDLVEDTTFTLVANNPAGEARADHRVRLIEPPSIEGFVADRSWVGLADPVELSWQTSGAVAVELWVDGVRRGEVDPATTTGGATIHPSFDAEVELRAYNEVGAEVRSSLQIQVAPPEILEATISASRLWLGESLSLAWTSAGAREVEVTAEGLEAPICSSQRWEDADGSSCEWQPPLGDFLVTVSFANGSGVESTSFAGWAGLGPRLVDFWVTPPAITAGDEIELGWEVFPDPAGEIPKVELTDDRGNTYPVVSTSGSLRLELDEVGTHRFELVASTTHQDSTPAEAWLEVIVHGDPQVSLSADPAFFDDTSAEEASLIWTSEHASSLVLYEVVDGVPTRLLTIPEEERAAGTYRFLPTKEADFQIVASNLLGVSRMAQASVRLAPPRILSFQADKTRVAAGEPVHLSWESSMGDEVSLSFIGPEYVRSERILPYEDVRDFPNATPLALGMDCSTTPLSTGCIEQDFPRGFTFPFGGRDHESVRIHSAGFLSFEALPTGSSTLNQQFPTSSDYAYVHLAPFWDSLTWDAEKYPEGNISMRLEGDERSGQQLIIQWKDATLSGNRAASLNFQVVLHDDGRFEYRYGDMDPGLGVTDTQRGLVEGKSATIGFQTQGQTSSDVIQYNEVVTIRGRLDGRAFVYTPAPRLTKSGTYLWYPYADGEEAEAELVVRRGELFDSRSLTVQVADRPAITMTDRPVEAVQVGAPFRLGWTTAHAHSLAVLDGAGDPICTAADQLEVEEGFCPIIESEEGRYQYRIRVEGERGSILEKPVTVTVHQPYEIVSFTVDEAQIEIGGTVTLRWETRDVPWLELSQDGTNLFPWEAPAEGSLVLHDVVGDSTFTLSAYNSFELLEERELQVEVVPIRLEVEASATRVRPGEAVTITASATALDGGDPPVLFGTAPLVEVEAPPPFQDISELPAVDKLPITGGGAALQSQYSDLVLPSGFDFPYFGERFRVLRVFNIGLVSFETPISHENNRLLPDAGSSFYRYHLAPFWDAILPNQGDAGIWAGQTDPDTFVIQWTNFSSITGSQRSNPAGSYSLNFQLALFRDGTFEYRYGEMTPPRSPAPGCQPSSCVNEANGSSATIGYQARGGTVGLTHHFGGATSGIDNPPYPGGLVGRVFRYEAIPSGAQLTFHPTRDAAYTFCASTDGEPICKTVEVTAPLAIEAFTADDGLIDHGSSTRLRWSTLGGRSLRIVDGSGAELVATSDPAFIDAGSVEIDPAVSTSYTLELVAADRRQEATAQVEVVRSRLTNHGPATAHPGQAVSLSWSLEILDPSFEPVLVTPMEETTGPGNRFSDLDISSNPGAAQLPFTTSFATPRIDFESDFSFDFFGTRVSSVGISPNGALTFDTGTGSIDPNNAALPNRGSSGQRLVHLAPFWDQLRLGPSAKGYVMRTSPDTYVIQWSAFSVQTGSADDNEYELDFMVVLHRGGDFEFRYGAMEPPASPSSSFPSCATPDCFHEANGSMATIGYQVLGGQAGFTLNHGIVASQLRSVAGGLSGRSWRYTKRTASAGTVQVAPWETTAYRICALDPATGDAACGERIDVQARWGIAAFDTDTEAILPPETVELSWEVMGLDRLRLLADGAVLFDQDGASIDRVGSFEHSPTATTTYVLEGTSAGRIVERTRVVEKRTLSLDFQAPPGRHFPGDEVALSWSVVTHEAGDLRIEPPPGELDGPPGATGTLRVRVGSMPEEHTLCASVGAFRSCATIRLAPVAEPGDLAITELMIDPAGGRQHQWFEVRNLRREPLDLAGFEIQTSRARQTIVDPLVIPAGGLALFAASAAALPAHAAYVLGEGIELHPRVEELRLVAGTSTIASARWDSRWIVPSGGSLSLDSSHHLRGISSHPFERFCRWPEIAPSPGSLGAGCRSDFYDLDSMGEGAWIDISQIGQEVRAFDTPSQVVELEVPGFRWSFFGSQVERLWVAGNGWVSFTEVAPSAGSSGPPALGGIPRSLSAQPPGPLIAGFWSTLRCDPFEHPCVFRHHHGLVGDEQVLILEWSGFRYSTLPGELNFQIQLWEDGDVKVVFGEVWSADPLGSPGNGAYHGNAAAIYLEGEDGSDHLVANHRRAIDLSRRIFHFKRR